MVYPGGGGGGIQYSHFPRLAPNMKSGPGKPQLVPKIATPHDIYYCRELSGAYQERTWSDIMNNCQPGYLAYAKETGYPYWVRTKND